MQRKQAEKLKSREMKEGWMKNDEGWIKKIEWWRMMISSYWEVLVTDKLTIGQSFVNVESLLGLKIESVSQE